MFAQQSSRCSECSGCVLSPSTEAIDKIKKLAYYQECPAIQDYIVSPDSLLTAVCFSSFVIARDMSLFSAVSGCTVAKSFRKAGKILTVAFPNDGLLGPPMRFTTLSVQSASQASPRGRLRFFSRVSNGSCMTIRCTYCFFMPLFHSQQGLDVVYVC